MYEITPEEYSADKITTTLLTAKLEEIYKHKPSYKRQKCSTFVVDAWNQEDIKKNEVGIWQYSGSNLQCFYMKQKNDGHINIEKCEAVEINSSHVMYLQRLHCAHPSNLNFKRLICFLSGQYNHVCCISCSPSILLKI